MVSVAVSPLDGPRTMDAIVSMWGWAAGSRQSGHSPSPVVSLCVWPCMSELLPNPVRPLLLLLT